MDISLNLVLKWYPCLPLGACEAKWPTQQNKNLVFLNTSGDVLVKIMEKVRAHFKHTGSGRGPTLSVRAKFPDPQQNFLTFQIFPVAGNPVTQLCVHATGTKATSDSVPGTHVMIDCSKPVSLYKVIQTHMKKIHVL